MPAVQGYVIEADEPGNYYHRSGSWVDYTSPANAYVWTPDETASIANAADNTWAHKPELAHPAIHDPATGVTVLTGKAVPINTVQGQNVQVPSTGGALFDLKAATGLAPASVVAMSVSL